MYLKFEYSLGPELLYQKRAINVEHPSAYVRAEITATVIADTGQSA
jgi:hypothetical protein